jgi:hypothetical protein
MNTSRREFMALTAASAAVMATGSTQATEIVGDGIADDTAAIQAVLDRGEVFRGEPHHKRHRITRTLYIPNNGAGLHGVVFELDLPEDTPILHCDTGVPALAVSSCAFFGTSP